MTFKFSNLNKIDIKDIAKYLNKEYLKEVLFYRLDIVICSAIIFLSLIIVVNAYKSKGALRQDLQTQRIELQKKIAAIKSYKQSLELYQSFTNAFPESIPSSSMINQLSQFATQHNISILNVSPGNKKMFDLFELTPINLTIEANEYIDLYAFALEIEKSEYPLRIDFWTTSAEETRRSNQFSRNSFSHGTQTKKEEESENHVLLRTQLTVNIVELKK